MKTKTVIILLISLITQSVFGQKSYDWDTTFVNSGIDIKFSTKKVTDDLMIVSTTIENKTVIVDSVEIIALMDLELIKFDSDSSLDFMLTYMGNNPTYILYIYDSLNKEYVELKNYQWFPYSKPIKNKTDYFYSYHRAGCADMVWVSDFYKIVDFKIIHIGRIDGKGCDFEIENNPQLINIYKILKNIENNQTLIESLPYTKHIPEFGDKWEFIEKYWNNNFQKFE